MIRTWSAPIALLLLTISPAAFAGGFEGNPDRLPSVGITLDLAGSSGDYTALGGGLSARQDTEMGQAALKLDTRVPVSNSLTLFGALSVFGSSFTAQETSVLAGAEAENSGFGITLGARIYFNQ